MPARERHRATRRGSDPAGRCLMSTTMNRAPSAAYEDAGRAQMTAHHPWRHFILHFVEMFLVMVVGMVAAVTAFMYGLNLIVGSTTWEEALVRYPVYALLVVAIGMSAPMWLWMRFRGHSRRSA